MNNKKLYELQIGIKAAGKYSGARFAYAMAKNLKKIESELELFAKILQPSKEYIEIDKKRIELCVKYAEQENGQPKMIDNNYIIDKVKKKEFDEQYELLKSENKVEYDKQEEKVKKFNEFMEEENDFQPYKVAMKDLPAEITGNELSGIFEFVDEVEPTVFVPQPKK